MYLTRYCFVNYVKLTCVLILNGFRQKILIKIPIDKSWYLTTVYAKVQHFYNLVKNKLIFINFEFLLKLFSRLYRGKSVSNEDLTAERDEQNFDDDVEPVEWRRVSKIRRSLQYPKTSSPR